MRSQFNCSISCLGFITTILFGLSAAARDLPIPTPEIHRITLHPSATTQPALRYRLLPEALDLTPGNAATHYLTASSKQEMAPESDAVYKKFCEESDKWFGVDSKKFDREVARKMLSEFQSPLRHLELGARQEECRWELPYRRDGLSTLLPHLSPLRHLATLLALQAHLEIMDGHYDDATHTLQTGFALARHLGKDGTLIETLVATGIAALMCEQIEFWIQQPGSPNLYWPLTNLPAPFFDFRTTLEHEHALIYYTIPHLKEAAEGKLTQEQYAEMLSKFASIGTEDYAPVMKFAVTVMWFAEARTHLPEMGYDKRDLDAMTTPQQIGLWFAQSFERVWQDMARTATIPFYDTARVVREHDLDKEERTERNLLIRVLMPSVSNARWAMTRLDQRVTELRCLEGIRAYAATHEGKLPGTLEAVSNTLAPLDPQTGKAFPYHVEGEKATMEIPIPSWRRREAKVDEIRMSK